MTERLKALHAGHWVDFAFNREVKCPHCGEDMEPGRFDMNRLYEEGEHEVDCPRCDQAFKVHTHVSFSFSTDKQP